MTPALGRLSEAPLYIDDTAAPSIMQIRAKARRLKAEKGLDLLIVDYLQLVSGDRRFENRTQEVSSISRGLKSIAKELKVPVLALSQLSRAPEQRTGFAQRPQLSDLRESGSIEQDADVVIFIFREKKAAGEQDGEEESPQGGWETRLIVGKQRNGPTGEVTVVFLKPYAKFENKVHDGGESDQ
jgi:replicative DNA helicase